MQQLMRKDLMGIGLSNYSDIIHVSGKNYWTTVCINSNIKKGEDHETKAILIINLHDAMPLDLSM